MRHRIQIAAFTCDLMIEEQERQDNVHRLIEECIEEFIGSGMKYSEQAAGHTNKMKIIFENEREWIRKIAIEDIQERVMKFEEQLSSEISGNSQTDQQNCSSSMNRDEDLNVFEVAPSTFCHAALVYNDETGQN